MKKNSSVIKKIFLVYILLFLIIVIASLVIYYIMSYKKIKNDQENTNIYLMEQKKNYFDTEIDSINRIIISLINSTETENYFVHSYEMKSDRVTNYNNVTEQLATYTGINKNIYSIYVYSSNGKWVISNSIRETEENFFDREWIDALKELKRNTQHITKTRKIPDYNDIEGRYVFTLTSTSRHENINTGKRCAVAVNINLESLYNTMRGNDKEYAHKTIIVTDEGTVIAHYDSSYLEKDISSDEYFKKILETGDNQGKIEDIIDGIEYSIYFTTSEATGWKIINMFPAEIYKQDIAYMTKLMIAAACLAFGIVIIIIIAAGKWAYRPMDRFIANIAGKLTVQQVKGKGKSDWNLELLENTFNSMVSEHGLLSRQLSNNLQELRWGISMEILTGKCRNYDRIKEQMELAGLQLYRFNYVVMVVCNDEQIKGNDVTAGDTMKHFQDKIDMVVNEEARGYSIWLSHNKIAIIVSFEDNDEVQNRISTLAMADIIKKAGIDILGQSISIGAGKQYRELRFVSKSYNEALKALEYRIITGKSSVVFFNEITPIKDKELFSIFLISKEILIYLKKLDYNNTVKQISAVFEKITYYRVSSETVRYFCLHIIVEAVKTAMEENILIEDVTEKDYADILDILNQYENFEDMKNYVTGKILSIFEVIKEKRSISVNEDYIEKIKEYIDKNYTNNNMSLNLLADKFNLSVSHLSKIFKKKTNTKFVKYLIGLRVEKAKELLLYSDKKISEIALEVGYANAHSFINIFKNIEGITPGEFKNRYIIQKAFENEV